jgi:hypothetical protein
MIQDRQVHKQVGPDPGADHGAAKQDPQHGTSAAGFEGQGSGAPSALAAMGNTAVARLLDGAAAMRSGADLAPPAEADSWRHQAAIGLLPTNRNGATARLLKGGIVQRCGSVPCDCTEEEELHGLVHRAALHGMGSGADPGPPDGLLASIAGSGGGRPLPNEFRGQAERDFGATFSDVRVHTDAAASEAAEQISAYAFTVGNDVYFASGHYDPESRSGQRLLAHELTHVVQATPPPAASGPSWLSRPDSASERAAEMVAERFVSGTPFVVALAPATAAGLVQRGGPDAPAGTGPPTAAPADPAVADAIVKAVLEGDVGAAVRPLRSKSVAELKAVRSAVKPKINIELDAWFVQRIRRGDALAVASRALGFAASVVVPGAGALATATTALGSGAKPDGTAEEGIRLLWPAMPLINRLEVYDEGWREMEQAQIDVIRAASADERKTAGADDKAKLEVIYSKMDPKEEYQARCLIDSTPEGKYAAAEKVLQRAPGVFHDEEAAVFDSLIALPPAKRKDFFDKYSDQLRSLLFQGQYDLVKALCSGTEAQALVARLRLATEGKIDDMAAVQAVVERAVELLKERRQLKGSLAGGALPAEARKTAEARVEELKDLDTLLEQRGADGALKADSFLGLLAGARGDAGAFGADAKRLSDFATGAKAREFALDAAKQRILLSGGNVDAIRSAIMELHAPRPDSPAAGPAVPGPAAPVAALDADKQHEQDMALRAELLKDSAVNDVIRKLTGFERMLLDSAVKAGPFEETLGHLADALNEARWGEFFRLILVIARNDDWRAKYENTSSDPAGVYARVHGRQRDIMGAILNGHGKTMPLDTILAFSGDVDLLRDAFSELPEDQRGRLRLGASLATRPPTGPPTVAQSEALKEYKALEAQARASQTPVIGTFDAAGFQEVLKAVLGSEPTAAEMATDEGLFRAAELMYQQQRGRLGLNRGASADFTETDETMAAAGREFAARFEPLRPAQKLTAIEFSVLAALHDRFEHRTEEFAEASNAVGEMAGMIAATVAGLVVVAATGGIAAPGVVALAAAAGGTARVVTREMFGADYYKSLSDEGARDMLRGAIDGALAVVGASLAARGVEMMGLGGHALASTAARVGGQVAEQASMKLSQKVAAGAVEAALDGMFSGAVSEAFGTMTDARTWRRGIWQGLVQVGQAAIVAGLTGLASGGLVGGALPLLGAGTSALRNAIVGQSIENSIVRAGEKPLLDRARAAAKAGEVDKVNEALAKLEAHLTPDEAATLRRQLNSELRSTLGHPPGTAIATKEQEKLLAESATMDGPALKGEHRQAELDLVAKSEPQPSTVDGFVDEVDLGNEHTWRRHPDGTWCRFSKKSLCGTSIPNARAMSPEQLAKSHALDFELRRLGAEIAEARQLVDDYGRVVDKLVASPRPDGLVNLSALSKEEQEVLGQIFPKRDIESLSMFEVQKARGQAAAKPGEPRATLPDQGKVRGVAEQELENLLAAQDSTIRALGESNRPLYQKLRTASPTGRATIAVDARNPARLDPVSGQMVKMDQISGLAPISGELDVDHILPLTEIMELRGFRDLTWPDQVAIADDLFNLRAVDRAANRSRGNRSWREAWPERGKYTAEALQNAAALEDKARVHLQNLVDACSKNPGHAARLRLQ